MENLSYVNRWTFPPLTFDIIILMLLKMIKTLIFFRVSEVMIQELNEDGVSFVEGSSPTVGIFEN